MTLSIAHDLPGRLRLRAAPPRAAGERAGLLALLRDLDGVRSLDVNPRTGSILIVHAPDEALRQNLLQKLREGFSAPPEPARDTPAPRLAPQPAHGGEAPPSLVGLLAPVVLRPVLPMGVRLAIAARSALPRIWRGAVSLCSGKLSVDVLDATALGICILRRDFRSLGAITLLLGLGEFLESWTRKRSEESLAATLAAQTVWAWVRRGHEEEQVDSRDVKQGDLVVLRQGAVVPVDGVVEEGEALVDQSAMTGEARGVPKRPGSAVFAGTVVEEGEVLVKAAGSADTTRWRRMLGLVEQAERSKAGVQSQAEKLAGNLVPFSLGLSGAVYAATRDPRRAASVLLVDYSCAIKLATPLAVLAAMRQMAAAGVVVKGGQPLEMMAKADVFVFDKTGTLTMAEPSVHDVIPFGGASREDVLRLAACLEEHFPHPVARAVVRQAREEGIEHQEEHARVEYVAAHGVASWLKGKRVLLGSRHFIHEDEGVPLGDAAETVARLAEEGHSLLYLAVGDELAGVISLDDPLRPEAGEAIQALRDSGVQRVIMLTGDLDGMAARISKQLGITEWIAQVLPDEKHRVIEGLMAEGHTVAMVGDGLNDAPALARASVGISMHQGADVTREVADVVLTTGDLTALARARSLARASLARIKTNYLLIVTVNSLLLAGGLFGRLTPQLSAVMHNGATLAAALNSLRPLALPR
ncbi:putative manganese/zinc-exporting P-type ATPase [Fundidesulfovibrio magnetotacticus]|uniref:P-type Zn(2+) transporter n=1 Tax=Fundidesulfovibrio magnetotacticus TaxID=2730080 RepID=A0A6V8M2P4_9BACT|nr:heavy metal translocating P-type ATPase [Fundidesulfovibrio magnetotacticus]GFK96087.1 putative manganese/zinc-exporting P-type ATPase [Fundidesulfovibrio magnetotacticus]